MARPSKFTEEVRKAICDNIGKGLTHEGACRCAGVSKTSFYDWKKQGFIDQKGGIESEYAEFADSLKKAEEEFKLTHLTNISNAAGKQWQAAAWLLERKYPNEFGRKDSLNVGGRVDVRKFDIELSEEQEAAYLDRAKAFAGEMFMEDEVQRIKEDGFDEKD